MSSRSAHMPKIGLSRMERRFFSTFADDAFSGSYFIRMRLGAPYREITTVSPVSMMSEAREQKSRLASAMLNVLMAFPPEQIFLHKTWDLSRDHFLFWRIAA